MAGEGLRRAPHIDYAGISPIIALTVGLVVVLLSGGLQADQAAAAPALTLLDPGARPPAC